MYTYVCISNIERNKMILKYSPAQCRVTVLL